MNKVLYKEHCFLENVLFKLNRFCTSGLTVNLYEHTRKQDQSSIAQVFHYLPPDKSYKKPSTDFLYKELRLVLELNRDRLALSWTYWDQKILCFFFLIFLLDIMLMFVPV